ncbi:MAG TPA: hypothetical protein VJC39_02465 [Candidatus Nanoarchaeia archaeon]|nr:hypothetical protein [Candidatus Nanoarchaeia archaeon]
MGVFDKLAFWKKKDELDFDELARKEYSLDSTRGKIPTDDLGLNEKSLFETEYPTSSPSPFSATPPSFPSFRESSSSKDLDLINSKLDTIKALLSSLDQRLNNLEKQSKTEQKPRLW